MSELWKGNEKRICVLQQDGAFSFANEVPGIFTNAKNADGFVKITELKPSHRTKIKAAICEDCRKVVLDY